MLKNIFITLLTIIFTQNIVAQTDTSKQFFSEIITENYRIDEKIADIGLVKKVKKLTVIFFETTKDENNIEKKQIIKDMPIGYFVNYDNSGFPTSYYQFETERQANNNELTINKDSLNYIFFNKQKLLEKHIHTKEGFTEIYDKFGNILETITEYPANTDQQNDSTAIAPIKIFEYNLKAYKYNKLNKSIEQTNYQNTFDRNILVPYTITKNKYNENGKIIESEITEIASKLTNNVKKNITIYKYDVNNKLISYSIPAQETTSNFKYDAKKNLSSITISNKFEEKNSKFANKRFTSKTITNTENNITQIDYKYTDDNFGNWITANIDIIENKDTSNPITSKYQIIRKIEYVTELLKTSKK